MATSQATQLDFLVEKTIPKRPYKIAILTAKWNWEITIKLLQGAENYLKSSGDVTIIKHIVPGTFELTIGSQKLAQKTDIDAIIALGCVIRGDTPHFDYICEAVSQGITNVSIKYDKPIAFGVLTTNTMQQAFDRAGGELGNKGSEAAATILQILNTFS